jgi:hypothetical protein
MHIMYQICLFTRYSAVCENKFRSCNPYIKLHQLVIKKSTAIVRRKEKHVICFFYFLIKPFYSNLSHFRFWISFFKNLLQFSAKVWSPRNAWRCISIRNETECVLKTFIWWVRRYRWQRGLRLNDIVWRWIQRDAFILKYYFNSRKDLVTCCVITSY